jgi:DNA-binding transcriptional regulator YdaS (Cro superfamily)
MNFKEFINLSDNKVKARQLIADSLNLSTVTVRSWANGHRNIHSRHWLALEKATLGKVTITDLIKSTK